MDNKTSNGLVALVGGLALLLGCWGFYSSTKQEYGSLTNACTLLYNSTIEQVTDNKYPLRMWNTF